MRKRPFIQRKPDTSWQNVAKWYKKAVGESGLYYHQNVIIPKSLELLKFQPNSSLLDLACGEGIFSRNIPKDIYYQGVDLSADLIKFARENSKNKFAKFDISDVSKPLNIKKNDFTHGIIVLALQNIEDFDGVIKNASKHIQDNGKFLIVLSHPYFRIPRQSSWEIDNAKKLQYRRVDRYLSELKIPINMHPGMQKTTQTWSFHRPLSKYISSLSNNGFLVSNIEEWTSDKVSVGKAGKMENRARKEFPLFMAILAIKKA